MKERHICFALGAIAAFMTSTLYADNQPAGTAFKNGYLFENPADRNYFLDSEAQSRFSHRYSPGNPSLEVEGVGRLYEGDHLSGVAEDINMWCEENGKNINNCVREDYKESYFEPGTRTTSIVAFDSMAGTHDVMTSTAYTDQVNKLLSSPMAVLRTTWLMTEPGVAGGVSDAIKDSELFLQNRYLSDLTYLKRAENSPGTGELVMSAYNNCIAKQMDANRTWIEAQSLCLGGARTQASPVTFQMANAGSSYQLKDHPDHYKNNTDVGSLRAGSDLIDKEDHKISLVELLFQQESDFSHVFKWLGEKGGTTPDDKNETPLKGMAEGWRRIMGDVEFTISDPSENKPGLRRISVRKILPRVNPPHNKITGSAGARRAGAKWYFRNLTKSIYREMLNLLYNYCVFNNTGNCSTTATAVEVGDAHSWYAGGSASDKNFFWNSDKCLYGTNTDLKNARPDMIGMRGFWLSPHLGDMLFYYFKKDGGVGSDGKYDCVSLDVDSTVWGLVSGPGSIRRVMRAVDKSAGTDNELRAESSQRTRVYFYIARKIALGQFLNLLKKAEEHLLSLSVGSYSNLAREYGLEMIYQTAGTRDIMDSYEKNLKELRVSVEGLYQQYANTIGSTSVIARVMQQEEGAPNGHNPFGSN